MFNPAPALPLDDAIFRRMNDVDVPVADVLAGIDAAHAAGFSPLKLNCVVQRGVNDAGIEELAGYAREHGHVLRFIEYMDVGTCNGWSRERVVPSAELRDRIAAHWPLRALDATHGEVKSMRTAQTHLRRGVAATMLDHILAEARRRGYARLSLETGSMAYFAPAHALYARAGFRPCAPFGDYVEDPNSIFMTRAL